MTAPQPLLFLTDNNVPDSVGAALAALGHDIQRVREVMAADAPDPVVAAAAMDSCRVLVSWDRDFNHQRFRQPRYEPLRRIGFSCPEPQGVARLHATIDLIEFLLRRTPSGGLVILIGRDKVVVRA